MSPRPTEAQLPRVRDLKADARHRLRASAPTSVIVSVIGSGLIWPVVSPSAIITASRDILLRLFDFLHLTGARAGLESFDTGVTDAMNWTSLGQVSNAGVISGAYHTIQDSGSLEKAVLYALSSAVFHSSVSASVIAVLALLLTIGTALFLRNPLRISGLRYYLEARVEPDTPATRLMFIFRRRRTFAMAWAVVYKYFRLALWACTVVMFPVKYYSYLLYDYVLAEDPTLSPREAMRLSEQLMKGNRIRAFRLDLSFAGWYALGLLTFGVVSFFYATPYRNLAFAGLYTQLREADGHRMDLTDPHPPPLSHLHYARDYSPVNLVWFFFVFSGLGWAYESVLSVAYVGHFVNRGTLYGPWTPIYGTGAVAVLLVLKRLRDHPLWTFGAAMVVCGIIEYSSATIVKAATGLSYWSYDGYFFNIQGRVCLEGLLVFGLGCSALVYFLGPILDTWLNKIPLRVRKALMAVFVLALIADVVFTLIHPHTGLGITS